MAEPLGKIIPYFSKTISTRYNADKFVGREWLIEEVVRFKDDEDRRHLIIVGEPGSGKSAIVTYLAELWNCPRYFIRVDNTVGLS